MGFCRSWLGGPYWLQTSVVKDGDMATISVVIFINQLQGLSVSTFHAMYPLNKGAIALTQGGVFFFFYLDLFPRYIFLFLKVNISVCVCLCE